MKILYQQYDSTTVRQYDSTTVRQYDGPNKPYCRTIVLSCCLTVVLSYYRTIVLSYCRTIVLPYYRTVVLSYWCGVPKDSIQEYVTIVVIAATDFPVTLSIPLMLTVCTIYTALVRHFPIIQYIIAHIIWGQIYDMCTSVSLPGKQGNIIGNYVPRRCL